MTAIPPRSFLGKDYNHLRIGGSTLTTSNHRTYTIRDIVNSIEYTPNFNVRQSMTGGGRRNRDDADDADDVDDVDDTDDADDADEYLYGVISG
jgi:hypothetical protein